MAEWYCGSVQYAAVAQFAVSHAYSVGDIVRQLATPTAGNERCFRCTTAGTSAGTEAAWNTNKGATTTQGAAIFTEVTGNSTYAWNAPQAMLRSALSTGWAAAGDTIYVASNHSVSFTGQYILASSGTVTAPVRIVCVNAAGSVPPVAADVTTGAFEKSNNSNVVFQQGSLYAYGVTFQSDTNNVALRGFGGPLTFALESCKLVLASASATQIEFGDTNEALYVLYNTTVQFGATGSSIRLGSGRIEWRNTASAIQGATLPTTLFTTSSFTWGTINLTGVDLSALGSGKTLVTASANGGAFNFINCKLGASVTTGSVQTVQRSPVINLVSSDAAAHSYRQERYLYEGALTTETTIVRSGGASDGTTPLSWKIVTSANAKGALPFEAFNIAEWEGTTGAPVTATVEVVNDGVTLTNADIWLEAYYMGSAGDPGALMASSGLATPLSTATNLPTSTATWTTTGIASPVKQYLQVSFTPQLAGVVNFLVRVGKASQTLYVDPLVTLS